MEPYKIIFKSSIKKDLQALPQKEVLKIIAKIKTLSQNPFPPNHKKLKSIPAYRIRQGKYRILYTVEKEIITITIIKISHRKSAY